MLSLMVMKVVFMFVVLVVFLAAQFVILRVFDNLLGISFRESFKRIEADPRAMATYFGLRWLGVSITLGLLVSVGFVL